MKLQRHQQCDWLMAEWIFGIAIEIQGNVVTVDDHPVANQKNGIIEKLLINFDEGGLFGGGEVPSLFSGTTGWLLDLTSEGDPVR